MPGSKLAKAVMIGVTVIIILGLLASAVASPISV
jgi:hypothetical protein